MKKTEIYSILAALLLAVVAFLFFFPDDVTGNVLKQHDILQGLANGQEGKAFQEQTGEATRWTNSLFGGMPTFQISPSYPANNMLDWIQSVYTLGLPSPANLLFAMMLGFFILCMCMDMKWYTSLFAALAWGFSSYFIIIIGAGHIWKFITLAYIPPTIAGLVLLYRGKYAAGTAVTALFAALQLQGNHPQMTYYFAFVMLALVLAWLYTAIHEHKMRQWGIATCLALLAGCLALGANSASLYNTYEYSKQTIRGHATELSDAPSASSAATPEGMDHAAITAWSYGIDETFSLLIPNVKGGASAKPVGGELQTLSVAQIPEVNNLPLNQEEIYALNQFPQYFGNQPMTNGPVYVGAFVLLLAILAMFVVDGKVMTPMKWALFAVSLLAIFLSWGHNFPVFTDFMIDYFPGYNKFRTVSSILVIVEFCVPLLAAMCLVQMLRTPDFFAKNKYAVIGVMGAGAFICLIAWLFPSMFGSGFSIQEMEFFQQEGLMSNPQYANLLNGLSEARLSLVSADALRSLIFIALGCGLLWLWFSGKIKNKAVFVCALSAVVLIDLFSVSKRYVNSENFTEPLANDESFEPTAADRLILQDKSHHRVLDLYGFSQARSSYFHHTLGGYHAAKLTRYNDLIEKQLTKDNWQYLSPLLAAYAATDSLPDSPALNVLNMLNTKYIINTPLSDSIPVIVNPHALGNAWIVDRISYVDNANAEMKALDNLDTRHAAVADKLFQNTIGNTSPKAPGDTIYLVSYAPNRLQYKSKSAKGGVAVFSEVYFPWGWNATVDGKPTDIGRVNYVLRAIRIPAGQHDIEFVFNPESLNVTNTLAVVCVIVIYVIVAGAIALYVYRRIKRQKKNE